MPWPGSWRIACPPRSSKVSLSTIAPAQAQGYPTRAVTIIVPLAAGTGMDTLARLYGDQLGQALGKPVVIENRPGAGLMLGTAAIAAAPPDGHTLGISTAAPMSVAQVLYKRSAMTLTEILCRSISM